MNKAGFKKSRKVVKGISTNVYEGVTLIDLESWEKTLDEMDEQQKRDEIVQKSTIKKRVQLLKAAGKPIPKELLDQIED